ncbi:uncharacterized protein PAC_07739 [Phialocephala subalpina]|uniref:Uncharacterized protein n=1 Tax=Phialocephala subalpina TaxID=576137 RepID=A0A1L7WYN6_9HELO|nr:uncharacterized protein PAC_07739 [Phialocephala subalpina]
MSGRGFNTAHGFDQGPPPPGAPGPFPGGIYGFPSPYYPPPPYGYPQQQQQPFYPQQPIYQPAQQYPPPYGGFGMGGQPWQTGPPLTDGGYPGTHLRNDTAGVGCPLGYNYCFPTENTKIHILKSDVKPWQVQLYTHDSNSFTKHLVPTNVTMKEFMKQFGCDNPDAAKNIVYEIAERGNGRWSAGLRIKGDDKDKMKKTLADFGWDKSRTGYPGQKPVVWLWLTNEGL